MLARFFLWYFVELPRFWLVLVGNYTRHWFFLFGVGRHLSQLFYPWKRLVDTTHRPGFDLEEVFNKLSYNIISRVIGACIRLATVSLGCVVILLNWVWWLLVLSIWAVATPGSPLWLLLFWLVQATKQRYQRELARSWEVLAEEWRQEEELILLFNRLGLSATAAAEFLSLVATWEGTVSLQAITKYSDRRSIFLVGMVELLGTPSVQQFFLQKNFQPNDIQEVLDWRYSVLKKNKDNRKFWSRENLQKQRAIGKEWAFGYTPTLDRYSIDLATQIPADLEFSVRDQFIAEIEQLFAKAERNNILLVGQAGVGKKTVCYLLAKRIKDGLTIPELADHRVLQLDIDTLLAQEKNLAQQLQVLRTVLAEAHQAGNCILVVDNIDLYVDGGGNRADLSSAFKELEDNARIKLIGLSTPTGYQSTVTHNNMVYTAFEVLQLKPTSSKQTLTILLQIVPDLEKKHGVFIEYSALKELVEQGASLLPQLPFPEKAVNLIDEAVVVAKRSEAHRLTKEIIDQVLSQRSGVPVSSLSGTTRQNLLALPALLKTKVIGQDQAIEALVAAVQKSSVRLQTTSKPIGTFLFLGPTGVGKTETAKALASAYFGDEKRLIRIDCGQYTQAEDIHNLLGAPAGQEGHSKGGQLTEAVRSLPHSVVLFDELEKAHPEILVALLPLLDEGYLVDSQGQQISFQHTAVIATSNAAGTFIQAQLLAGVPLEKVTEATIQKLVNEHTFLPEFLNRFDGIIAFAPLDLAAIAQIAQLKVANIAQQLHAEYGVILEVSPQTIETLVAQGWSQEFGARHLQRVITENITNVVTQALLQNQVKAGEILRI